MTKTETSAHLPLNGVHSGIRQADMEQLRTEVAVEGLVAGRLLNLSRNTTYKALRNGDIPSVRIGAQYRVPTAKLREMLGLPSQTPIAA